ncbi:uncharacterized protein MONBRDRAFT_31948 [Monosiga brevicollis MX1]|uniref:Phthiocerol/phthiodiolone dimycocerosyl transferase C-terminal domain-containing protein n=1 Tax=Monosiga brevicollis TaxID=81824 RepID=A9UWF2_MONBE|nr:uncharacterized protein MONBRDRAFT_31948 [Monosiga brevicollis MX1]EDQ90754.1 predicted protein [Monosiga brevicollis MX1]|eukprot:XP_001744805.1 hypothetical protein [Monosiga brevicollis MX1]
MGPWELVIGLGLATPLLVLAARWLGRNLYIGTKKWRYASALELGFMDRWYAGSHDARNVVAFGLCLHLQTRKHIHDDQVWHKALQQALMACLAEFPLLRCSFARDAAREPRAFTPLPDLPTAAHEAIFIHALPETRVSPAQDSADADDDAQRLNELVDRLNQEPFLPDALQCQLHLLRSRCSNRTVTVVLKIHHAIADGIGATALAPRLLQCLDQALAHPDQLPDSVAHTYEELSMPMETALDMRPSLHQVLTEVLYDQWPNLRPAEQHWLGPSDDPARAGHAQRRPAHTMLRFTPLETAQLQALARRQGTTVNGLMMSAAAIATTAFAPSTKLGHHHPVQISCVANLRPFCRPIPTPWSLRAYLSTVDIPVTLHDHEPACAVARMLQQRTRAEVANAGRLVGLLQFVSGSFVDLMRRLAQRSPNGRRTTTGVSNLGFVRELQLNGAAIELKSVDFVQSNHADGPVFNISVITAGTGAMSIQAAWTRPITSDADGREFGALLRRTLDTMLSNPGVTHRLHHVPDNASVLLFTQFSWELKCDLPRGGQILVNAAPQLRERAHPRQDSAETADSDPTPQRKVGCPTHNKQRYTSVGLTQPEMGTLGT